MPSTTTNLGLYKKNPSTDGNDTFDINTMLNDNWDTLDAQLGVQFADAAPTAVNLVNGLQVVDVPQTAPLENLRITGRTLVNLLGRDGNCEDLGKWVQYFGATLSLDSTNQKFGNNAIKFICTSTSNPSGFYKDITNLITPGKYYVVVAELKNGNVNTGVGLQVNFNGSLLRSTLNTTTNYQPKAIKFQAPLTGLSYIYAFGAHGTPVGQYGYADGVRIYEITSMEYTALESMTEAQIAAKYPYVDDVKHITSPYILKYGENLLTQVNEMSFNGGTTAGAINTINGPYQLTVDSTGVAGGSEVVNGFPDIPLVPNTSYTLKNPSPTGYMRCRFDYLDGSIPTRMVFAPNSSRTFTTPYNIKLVSMVTSNLISFTDENNPATYVFGQNLCVYNNPILTVGTAAKSFKSRNDDMLTFPNVQLASNVDATVYDTLFKRDGKYFVEKRYKDVLLDGSFPWIYGGGGTGWKYVSVGSLSNSIPASQKLVKYDGKIIGETAPLTAGDQSDLQSNGFFYISITSADSGWGDSYTPTAQDIQAYFYGWKMYDNVNTLNLYNSGTKAWVRISKIVNGIFTGVGGVDTTLTLPTSASGAGYTSYKLTYQLITPTYNEIQVEGSLTLHEGLSQVEAGQGVVVREKANPSLNSGIGFAAINVKGSLNYNDSCALRYKLLRFRAIYKNGLLDTRWTIKASGGNGNFYADIHSENYDLTATYEVSYIALDQYLLSSPVRTVLGETASNHKMAVDTLVMNDVDLEARVSAAEILARQIYNVPQKTTADMTLYVDGTNGADSGAGSAENPFKTIQRAVNSIPQIVNHKVAVYVAAGTYNEDVVMDGFILGENSGVVAVKGSATAVAPATHNANSFWIRNCFGRVSVEGFNVTSTTMAGISASYSNGWVIYNCTVTTSSISSGIAVTVATGRIEACTTSNRGTGINISYYSHVYLQGCIGTNNIEFGINSSEGAFVSADLGTTVTGNLLARRVYNGGLFTPSIGILNPWGDNTFSNRSYSRAFPSIATSVSSSVWTKVNFGTEGADNLGEYDPTLSRFTAKAEGVFNIVATVQITGATSGATSISLYANGTPGYLRQYVQNGAETTLAINENIYIPVGSYVEVYVYQNSGSTKNTDTNAAVNRFIVTRIA